MTSLTSPRTLPLLPLTTGVVLPQMVVTLALETDEAQAAADAALGGRRPRPARAPHRAAATPASAPSPTIEDAGDLPERHPGRSSSAASQRAVIGAGVPGDRRRPVGAGRAGRRARARPTVPASWRASTAPSSRTSSSTAAPGRSPRRSAASPTPARWPTPPATRPTSTSSARSSCSRPSTSRSASRRCSSWARETLAELELKERIRTDVTDGMEKTQREFLLRQQMAAIRKELGEDGDGDDVVDELPRASSTRRTCPTTCAPRSRREIDRLERTAEQSPEHGWIRTWLDTVLELPWGERTDDQLDVAEARAHPRRRPHRPRRREGPHRRVPRRPQAAGRAGRRSRRAAAAPAPSSPWSARPASARRRSASRSPAPSAASSSASPSAASATRPRSAATGAPTSAPCPAASSGPSRRPAR